MQESLSFSVTFLAGGRGTCTPAKPLTTGFTVRARLRLQSSFALHLFAKHLPAHKLGHTFATSSRRCWESPCGLHPLREREQRARCPSSTHSRQPAVTSLVLSEVPSYFCWKHSPRHRLKGGRRDPP